MFPWLCVCKCVCVCSENYNDNLSILFKTVCMQQYTVLQVHVAIVPPHQRDCNSCPHRMCRSMSTLLSTTEGLWPERREGPPSSSVRYRAGLCAGFYLVGGGGAGGVASPPNLTLLPQISTFSPKTL